jgi:hypothetical protein
MGTYYKWIGLTMTITMLLVTMNAFAGPRDRASDFNLVVQWQGKGGFEYPPHKIANLLPPGASGCFVVDMIDPSSGWHIGRGYDCILSGPMPVGDEGGFTIDTAYVFEFFKHGTIVSVHNITVQPALDASADETGITHILGDFPTENTIYSGLGKFRNATGKVRLSGGNDLRELDLTDLPNSFITFDYLFVLSLDD